MVCEKCKPEFDILLTRIESLERRLLAYENAHTPPSKKRKRQLPPPTGKIGAPLGHPGATRPTAEPTMTIEPTKERCDHCHAVLGAPFHRERRVIEEIPEPQALEVTEYIFGYYECLSCGKITVADVPLPDGRFGPRACAHVALLKFSDRLPCKLVVRALERQCGLMVTPATILDITRRVADAAKPHYRAIITRIQNSPVVHVDETPIRVGGRTHWVWVFTTPTETLYLIRPTRGKSVPREILADYKGVVISDGYKLYEQFGTAQQRCWAHLLREAKELAEKHVQVAGLYQELKSIYAALSERLKNGVENRLKTYDEFILRMRQWLDVVMSYRELRKFGNQIASSIARWFTCILHPGVPPTNNLAERQLREIVVQRKIIGTLRNEKGTSIMETIMSALMTWQQQGIKPLVALQDLLRS